MTERDSADISKVMKISKLPNGTVIDHLRPGTAMKAIQVLGITDGSTLSIGMYLESKKLGRKDILKIENRTLTADEINKIAVLSPEASVCTIKNYKVEHKFKVHLPEEVAGIIRCINPKCITNHEPVETRFAVVRSNPLTIRCRYCERAMAGEEIVLL